MHRIPRAGRRAVVAAATAGAIAAATLVAGCSSSSDSDNQPAAIDIAPAGRAAVRDGGTMRWAVDDVPQTLNAYQDDADAQTTLVAEAALPAMFTIDGHGRPQRDADYLQSATVTGTSPQVVVYHINPKAVWSNGRSVTAADFKAQWRALSGNDTDFFAAHNTGYDRIAKVQSGKDPHEVKVTFRKPLGAWQSLFTPLYPKEITGNPDAFNDGANDALRVSAGPFEVRDVDADGGTVTMARDPRWWGRPAKLSRLVLTAVPRDQRAAALAGGRVDVAEVDAAQLPQVKRIHGVAVRRAPSAEYTQLTLNGGSTGPLADPRVRRAVVRAIDRQAIADSVLRPAGLPARTLGNHLVLGSQFGYHDDSAAIGHPDLKSARNLLAAAGWQTTSTPTAGPTEAKADGGRPGKARPAGSGTPVHPAAATSGTGGTGEGAGASAGSASGTPSGSPSDAGTGDASDAQTVVDPAAVRTNKAGVPLTLRFVLPQGSPTLDAVGGQIAHMLAGIGVRTELDRVSDDGFFRDHVATGDFDLALYSWPGSPFPADDARSIYLKPLPASDGSLMVRQNYSRVGTDRIDQLLDQAADELDQGKARDIAQQADDRLWAVAGSVPLYQPPQLVAARSDVANVGAFGFQTPDFQDIGFHR